jgi:hypothetical protein
MGKAVEDVFTEAWHGLCTYHIMQNVTKHLCNSKDEGSFPAKMRKMENLTFSWILAHVCIT